MVAICLAIPGMVVGYSPYNNMGALHYSNMGGAYKVRIYHLLINYS